MTADDPDRPRKTLTLTRPVRDAHPADTAKRKRSGSRARLVAQNELQREKGQHGTASDPAAPAETRPARAERAERPSRGKDHGAKEYNSRERSGRGSRSKEGGGAAAFHDTQPAGTPYGDERPAADAPERDAARRPRGAREVELFTVFTPCPQGIEEALAAELQALGFEDAHMARAGCRFTTDWQGVQRANLYSRLATRVLVQVAQGPVQHEDDLLDLAYATPWERWFGAEHTLRVDTSAIKSPMRSLQYCNLRVKDGICDRLLDREGARPDIDTVRPDARVHSFLTQDTATLYLDTSGESLFKRGWRLDKGEAPLRENLAAGMLALAGWDPAAPLLDPFCGSGTILIEAAWIALGVPPGISRPFGFERLRGHDAHRWHDLKDDARAHILPQLDTPLFGYDLDPAAIAFAEHNAERAWLTEDTIRFEVGDARTLRAPAGSGWIVTNPPYGERMLSSEEDDLWREWATCLKRQFGGWQLHVITSDMTLPQQLRLKPMRRTPLYNGALDCRLFGFELVSAGYRERAAGPHGAADPDQEDQDSGEPDPA